MCVMALHIIKNHEKLNRITEKLIKIKNWKNLRKI